MRRGGYRAVVLLLSITTTTTTTAVTSARAFVLEDDDCNYLYSNHCLTKPRNVPMDIRPCKPEEVAKDVNFVLLTDQTRIPPVMLKAEFAPPKERCKYAVTLLANESIRSESECANHTFDQSVNGIEAETHTGLITICNVPHWRNNDADVGDHRENDNDAPNEAELSSPLGLCQENVSLRYQYIFTGCYAIMFHLAENRNEVRGNVFLPTNYKRTEVSEPSFSCKQGVAPNAAESASKGGRKLFVTEIAAPADTEISLRLLLDSRTGDTNNDGDSCRVHAQSILYSWTVNVEQNSSDNDNCSINVVHGEDGKPVRTAECRFIVNVIPEPVEQPARDYCFLISLNDERCKKSTLWNPPMPNNIPCTWTKRCDKVQNLKDASAEVHEARTWIDTNTYLLLPAAVIVTITFTTLGMIYLVHYWRARKDRLAFYIQRKNVICINGEISKKTEEKGKREYGDNDNDHDDDDDDYDGEEEEEEEVEVAAEAGEEDFNRDIVLLYAKSTESFMALMAEFRGILGRICHCSVHDWYDGSVWNHVAKVGGPEWFAEMLESGCRVVWMDTPAIRSLVTSEFRKELPGREEDNRQGHHVEIEDFRDVLFPTVFHLAKQNIRRSTTQCPIHYIVRLTGFDNFGELRQENRKQDEKEEKEGAVAGATDPFMELSPYTARYLIPSDLGQLCSHLNSTNVRVSAVNTTRLEEDLIRQHLIRVESRSYE